MTTKSPKRDPPSMDVLIVGAGPVGYMAAVTLARYGINFRIIDKRALPVQTGHASGLQPRTQEIFHTMGIVDKLTAQAGQVRETAFWGPAASDSSNLQNGVNGDAKPGIKRTSVGIEVTNATPYPRVCVNHQGNVEATFEEELRKRGHGVHRPMELLHYEYTEQSDYPLHVHLKDRNTGAMTIWRCKYLLGSDGAGSVSRTIAGITSQRHDSQDHWAVADVQFSTDFPDFRRRCAIQTQHGNLMLIPSPNNTMRIYMLLSPDSVEELETSAYEAPTHSAKPRTNTTTILDILERRIPAIIHPYTLTITAVDWISRYTVTQRIVSRFSDAREHGAVFLLGDACHTHSPKAGQGMNIGMQDAYNLTWKLALVLQGRAQPQKILTTYETERKHIAEQLIAFDTKFAKMFAAKKALNAPEFHGLWEESHGFTSGCGHRYLPGLLVNPDTTNNKSDSSTTTTTNPNPNPLAPIPGTRHLPTDHPLTRHIDGQLVSTLDELPCTGPRFHIIVWAGSSLTKTPTSTSQTTNTPNQTNNPPTTFSTLYTALLTPTSPLHAYSTSPSLSASTEWAYEDAFASNNNNGGRAVDLSIIHTVPHLSLDLLPTYRHWKFRFYEDVGGVEHVMRGLPSVSEANPEGEAKSGITIEVVRPDGVVGMVVYDASAGDVERIGGWMDGFMVRGGSGSG